MRAHHHYYSLTNKVLSKLDEKQRIFINSLIFVNKQLILLFNYLKKTSQILTYRVLKRSHSP